MTTDASSSASTLTLSVTSVLVVGAIGLLVGARLANLAYRHS